MTTFLPPSIAAIGFLLLGLVTVVSVDAIEVRGRLEKLSNRSNEIVALPLVALQKLSFVFPVSDVN